MYTGNSAYCYSNSLHICLQAAGMGAVPNVGFLECLTGLPFGSCFISDDDLPLFFPSPARTHPHEGLSRALETLGWTCNLWQGDNATEARVVLESALSNGPVLLGPVDMSFLSYDPNHKNKTGADHFVVVVGMDGDLVTLHDPQFYPYATLPLNELMQAWNATPIGYMEIPYTLRTDFREVTRVARDRQVRRTLDAARMMQTDVCEGPVAYAGATAFKKVVALLEPSPPPALIGFLIHFALPLGARRCIDARQFMAEAGQSGLMTLYDDKAKLYGRAQYYAVAEKWEIVSEIFGALAELEDQLQVFETD
ncbi:MAG: BtrH N-terminal domain-containing protein [Chloroflexota bacterium]